MKAFLIDPVSKMIEPINLSGEVAQLKTLLDAKAVEFDTLVGSEDRLCFDEDCFITQKPGRFQLDTLAPVAGRGLVLGAEGQDVSINQASLATRIKFSAD